MDTARCTCPQAGRNPTCPFHGDSGKDPIKPWRLSEEDRKKLRDMRIAFTDSEEIQQVRKLDEDRFRP